MKGDAGMLYNGRMEVGLNELANINTALLSTSDYIFINANYTITKTKLNDYEHIRRVMDDYIQEGIIRLWDYPCTGWSDGVTVLPQQDYSYWCRLLRKDEQVEELRQLDDYLSRTNSSLERSSMMIDLAKEHRYFAVCQMLKADQIMLMPLLKEIKKEMEWISNYRYANRQSSTVKKIFDLSEINMYGLAFLSAQEMKKQIKKSKGFRDFISEAQINGSVTEDEKDYFNGKLDEYVRSLIKEYKKLKPSTLRSLVGHAMNATALLAPGEVGNALSIASEVQGVFNDITSKTCDNKSMLCFITDLAKLTAKESKKNISERKSMDIFMLNSAD